MIEKRLSLTELILFAGTRVALGVGIGLLLSRRLSNEQKKAAGVALAVVGGLTTIPLVIGIAGRRDRSTTDLREAA